MKFLMKKLAKLERFAAKYQGKGWGKGSLQDEFDAALKLLGRKPKLCIDIGGNKGAYSEAILSRAPGCEIVIFEPAKVNVDLLTQKFSDLKNVTVAPLALSNEAGSHILYSDEPGSGIASLNKRKLDHFDIYLNNEEEIQSTTFLDYWSSQLDRRHIDFVKLDIEGHELTALQGFGEALQHVDLIQFEFGGTNIDARTFLQDFWYLFLDNGFDLYRITPMGAYRIEKYVESDERFVFTNYLAKKRS